MTHKRKAGNAKGTASPKKAKTVANSSPEREVSTSAAPLPECKYGAQCYQKNWKHLQKYAHGDSCSAVKVDPALLGSSEESAPKKSTETTSTSTADAKEKIQEFFLVDMPDNFYGLWDFCQELDSAAPATALKEILNLELVGPYELLQQSATPSPGSEKLLVKWRYYYDPPEFQTVLKGNEETGFHVGYFRDDPKELPAFVAANTEKDGAALSILGDNLLAAIHEIITEKLSGDNPKDNSVELDRLRVKLIAFAKDHGFDLIRNSKKIKDRQKKTVAKTFYGVGIVVPYNKKTQVGYRDVIQSPVTFKKILTDVIRSKTDAEKEKKLEPLEEYVSAVQLANDECDLGAGLELGLDLLAFGGEVFHPMILGLLSVSYNLLERQEWLTILHTWPKGEGLLRLQDEKEESK